MPQKERPSNPFEDKNQHNVDELLSFYYAQLGDYRKKNRSVTTQTCETCRDNHGSFTVDSLGTSRNNLSTICAVLDKHRDQVLSLDPERFLDTTTEKYDDLFFTELTSLNHICSDFVTASQTIRNSPLLFSELEDTCLHAPVLGMSLVDHDAKNLFMAFEQLEQLLSFIPPGSKEAIDFVKRNEYDVLYQNACMMLFTIYSIADNELHSYRIPSESIPSLMNQSTTQFTGITFNYDPETTIDSYVYYTTLQFVKNAVSYGLQGATDKTIKYEIDDKKDSLQLLVEDKGQGIPKSCIKDIFATYSKNSTGIGLQAARALVSLTSGSLRVRTTHQDETYEYSLDTDEIEECAYYGPGTCFMLSYTKKYDLNKK